MEPPSPDLARARARRRQRRRNLHLVIISVLISIGCLLPGCACGFRSHRYGSVGDMSQYHQAQTAVRNLQNRMSKAQCPQDCWKATRMWNNETATIVTGGQEVYGGTGIANTNTPIERLTNIGCLVRAKNLTRTCFKQYGISVVPTSAVGTDPPLQLYVNWSKQKGSANTGSYSERTGEIRNNAQRIKDRYEGRSHPTKWGESIFGSKRERLKEERRRHKEQQRAHENS